MKTLLTLILGIISTLTIIQTSTEIMVEVSPSEMCCLADYHEHVINENKADDSFSIFAVLYLNFFLNKYISKMKQCQQQCFL